jgi:uncharacterized protein (DUF305 family)
MHATARHIALAACLLLLAAAPVEPDGFPAAMDAAMARMAHDMMQPPSGEADRDFAAMMVPHHQGAIDMAEAELRFGHDPVLRRLAQGIIVEQQQEIAVMRQALAALPHAPMPLAATQHHSHPTMNGMH